MSAQDVLVLWLLGSCVMYSSSSPVTAFAVNVYASTSTPSSRDVGARCAGALAAWILRYVQFQFTRNGVRSKCLCEHLTVFEERSQQHFLERLGRVEKNAKMVFPRHVHNRAGARFLKLIFRFFGSLHLDHRDDVESHRVRGFRTAHCTKHAESGWRWKTDGRPIRRNAAASAFRPPRRLRGRSSNRVALHPSSATRRSPPGSSRDPYRRD
uniref:Putative transposase n=1 Tax=Ixodes ricinus TaxID=34613 RepID=A0A6B0V1W7_IXORI